MAGKNPHTKYFTIIVLVMLISHVIFLLKLCPFTSQDPHPKS